MLLETHEGHRLDCQVLESAVASVPRSWQRCDAFRMPRSLSRTYADDAMVGVSLPTAALRRERPRRESAGRGGSARASHGRCLDWLRPQRHRVGGPVHRLSTGFTPENRVGGAVTRPDLRSLTHAAVRASVRGNSMRIRESRPRDRAGLCGAVSTPVPVAGLQQALR